jgi:hypothetical protein
MYDKLFREGLVYATKRQVTARITKPTKLRELAFGKRQTQ